MVQALNVPQSKVARHNLDSAAQRVVTLKELLGDDLPDMETIKAALIDGFTARARYHGGAGRHIWR